MVVVVCGAGRFLRGRIPRVYTRNNDNNNNNNDKIWCIHVYIVFSTAKRLETVSSFFAAVGEWRAPVPDANTRRLKMRNNAMRPETNFQFFFAFQSNFI